MSKRISNHGSDLPLPPRAPRPSISLLGDALGGGGGGQATVERLCEGAQLSGLGWEGLWMGQAGNGRLCLSVPRRDGFCGHLGEGGWAPLPRPPRHTGVKPPRASALAPRAIVFIYICLWSEIVTD